MARASTSPHGSLGTFAGVFTPSILTILGIILFLRLSWVVGSAGLRGALLAIALATAIVVLTSISVAAIATNMTVKGGGDYYLISRTLGVEFGGAIGVVLFLAQAVSIAFYCVGFGEALTAMLPLGGGEAARVLAGAAVAVLLVLAWLGADWATRFQFGVMAILVSALASFAVGGVARWDAATMHANWSAPADGPDFWVVFAIFFPAVTGFTQGVSMSGDLRDPGRSIPRGTFAAVGLSTVVYVGAAVLLAGALPSRELRDDYAAMREVARASWLIDAGVLAATLSSAMASFLGAPRILQSLARDRVFPVLRPFAVGAGPSDNPRRGVLLAAAIAAFTIAVGNLNVIARLVSMFFLVSYGLLNYATFFEARARSPSFRPRLRWFDQRLSLLGGLGCVGAIMAIDAVAGVVAAALLTALYQYLERTAGASRWADGSRSYHFQRVREHLFAMAADPEHPRDWRPLLLVFSNDSPRRAQLLRFASWVEGGSGLSTVVQILERRAEDDVRARREEALSELKESIEQAEVQAFPLVVDGSDLRSAGRMLLQAFGLGPIRANTILLNWRDQAPSGPAKDPPAAAKDPTAAAEDPPAAAEGAATARVAYGPVQYGRHLQLALRLDCNVIVLSAEQSKWEWLEALPPHRRRIDVWWWDDATSRLMLLLAYLMTRSEDAGSTTIRVWAGAASAKSAEKVRASVAEMLEEVRITAEVEVVLAPDADRVAEHAADAALVFLPIRLRGARPTDPFGGPLGALLERMPVTACVIAARDIELTAEPDEGAAAELAAAADAAKEAERELRAAEKEAARTAEVVRSLRAEVEDAPDADARATELGTAARTARTEAEKAAKRLARARARVDALARAAGLEVPDEPPAASEPPPEEPDHEP